MLVASSTYSTRCLPPPFVRLHVYSVGTEFDKKKAWYLFSGKKVNYSTDKAKSEHKVLWAYFITHICLEEL